MTGAFETLRASAERAPAPAGWTGGQRRAALERFARLGLPTGREEEWRFTSLSGLSGLAFETADPGAPLDAVALERLAGRPAGHRLVFVNGRHRPDLSADGGLRAGVFAGSLARALEERRESLEPHLGRRAAFEENAFAALNTAAWSDGALLELPAGAVVEEPIELVFVTAGRDGKPSAAHPRVLVLAGPDSEATVVEQHLAPGDAPVLATAVSELVLAQGARLDHYRVQLGGGGAFQVGLLAAEQGRESRLSTHQTALGSALARSEVRAVLGGDGGEAQVCGLYMADGRQIVDNHSLIEHRAAGCQSREIFKGILDGQARAVFAGRIKVHPGAQKTDAHQMNSNLLLSDDAVVDTLPQLEILADDVKCGHGGTVGQLDPDQLFYLRSRGVPRETARSLLVYAFAGEMVRRVRPAALRQRIGRLVSSRLPAGEGLGEAA